MDPTTALFVIIALVIGGYAGWHVRHARGAHADLQVHKARIPVFRRVRMRSGLIAAGVVAGTLLILHDMIR